MVIEFARNVCGLGDADSTEFNPATPHRVIYKLRELKGVDELGGTMRLGAYPCQLAEPSFAEQAYGAAEISERHRHRYEFNREFEETLTGHGMRLTGQTPDGIYVEICEVADHPWFLGCQFHPEFKSKPLEPHPLFTAFLGGGVEAQRRQTAGGERSRSAAGIFARAMTAVTVGESHVKVTFSNTAPLALIAGPCVIESEEHALGLAQAIRAAVAPYIFKASFDKANRSSVSLVSRAWVESGSARF